MQTSSATATMILGLAGLALSGCMTTRVEETKNAKTGIAKTSAS